MNQEAAIEMASFVLQAESVVVEHPEGECHLVGFADQASDTTAYLLLQRAFAFDAQDVAMGMDTYHVAWCDQETSGYGGISQFRLSPGHAQVTFAQDSPVAQGGIALLTIVFQLTIPEYLALQDALRRIFEGSDCQFVVDPEAPQSKVSSGYNRVIAPRKIVLRSLHGYRTDLEPLVACWIRDGVKYVGVIGADAARIEEAIDDLCTGDGSNPYFMLTASHGEGETLADAILLAEQLSDGFDGPLSVVEF